MNGTHSDTHRLPFPYCQVYLQGLPSVRKHMHGLSGSGLAANTVIVTFIACTQRCNLRNSIVMKSTQTYKINRRWFGFKIICPGRMDKGFIEV